MALQIAVMQSDRIPVREIAAELKRICDKWDLYCRCRIVPLAELRELYAASGAVDLMVLDADVQEAVAFATMLRLTLKDFNTQILFTAKTPFSALQLFACHPLNFLLLPLKADALEHVMLAYARIDYRSGRRINYRIGRKISRLPLQEFCYATAEGRKLSVVTESQIDCFYGTLKQVATLLNNPYFYLVSDTLLLNLLQIRQMEETLLTMHNHDQVPLGKGQQKMILERCNALDIS